VAAQESQARSLEAAAAAAGERETRLSSLEDEVRSASEDAHSSREVLEQCQWDLSEEQGKRRGLTLVHFSAQLERFNGNWGCA